MQKRVESSSAPKVFYHLPAVGVRCICRTVTFLFLCTENSDMQAEERRAYLELHIAVLLFGFTAILGDLIQLSALMLVWWRVLITSGSLSPWANIAKLSRQIPAKMLLGYAGIGVLVALHWLTFYGAIKLANASVSLVCLATTSFMTALIEPMVVRRPFRWQELGIGFLIIPGMLLVVNGLDVSMLAGVWVGLISALFVSIFTALNKRFVTQATPVQITFIELGSAWVFLSIVLLLMLILGYDPGPLWPERQVDWVYLLLLALLCTNVAYLLSIRALKHISAFASTLTVNLEPVYGIVLAWWLLGDGNELDASFYWGGFIIILAVFAYPLLKRKGWA
jgi:drug/metabolite transporter (DMT)-like permease